MAKQREKQPRDDAALITAIAGALVVGASAQATATTLAPIVGIPAPSLLPILIIARVKPLSYGIATLPSATALTESQSLEPTYRAQYVLAGSRRVQAAVDAGTPRREAIAREKVYFEQHLHAVRNRFNSAQQVDNASKKYGPVLGWHATLDSRTSKECREAHGKNFEVTTRPAIGYPGSVHPRCRCRAGRKFATSATVYSIKPEERAA